MKCSKCNTVLGFKFSEHYNEEDDKNKAIKVYTEPELLILYPQADKNETKFIYKTFVYYL